MSSFTDFFQPTPTPAPKPVEPTGFDLLRDLLMRKIFALQANPYGLSGNAASDPSSFFSTGLNMNVPAFTGTSGGVPMGGVNPAYQQLGGQRVPRVVGPRGAGPSDSSGQAGSPPPLAIPHMDAKVAPGTRMPIHAVLQKHLDSASQYGSYVPGTDTTSYDWSRPDITLGIGGAGLPNILKQYGNLAVAPGQWRFGYGPHGGAILPGYGEFTGAQHEFGGMFGGANAGKGQAVHAAGMTPKDVASWLETSVMGSTPGMSMNYFEPHSAPGAAEAARAASHVGTYGKPGVAGSTPLNLDPYQIESTWSQHKTAAPAAPPTQHGTTQVTQRGGGGIAPPPMAQHSDGLAPVARPKVPIDPRGTGPGTSHPTVRPPVSRGPVATVGPPTPTEGNNTITPGPPGGLGSGSQTPGDLVTLGTGSFPWLQRWTGGFQAPTSPWENQALGGIGNFAGSGFNLGNSQNYLNSVLGGNFLDVASNPYIKNIAQGADVQRQIQDDRALREMQSRAGASGNALSGALMQQEGDYLRGSNAAYNQMVNQMYQNMYSQERGYQNNAPNQQMGLTNTFLGGLGQEMNMGATPRNIQTNEMGGQYNDWLRQLQGLQGAYQYPDQALMSLLGSGGYHNYYYPSFSGSGASNLQDWLTSLLQSNGGSGVDWGGLIGSIFGGGGQTTDQTTQGQTDAHEVHYDSPSSYQDQGYYNRALTAQQNAAIQAQKPQNAGLNAGLGTAGIILTLLRLLSQAKGGGKAKSSPGGGASPGGNNPFSRGQQSGQQPFMGAPTEQTPYGTNNPFMQGPYLPPPEQTPYGSNDPNMQGPYLPPPEQTPYGSNDPNMYGPYVPPDWTAGGDGFNAGGDYSGGGVDLGGGFVT